MADEFRHDQSGKSDERRALDRERHDARHDEQDEFGRMRDHPADRPALTRREREERWPIG